MNATLFLGKPFLEQVPCSLLLKNKTLGWVWLWGKNGKTHSKSVSITHIPTNTKGPKHTPEFCHCNRTFSQVYTPCCLENSFMVAHNTSAGSSFEPSQNRVISVHLNPRMRRRFPRDLFNSDRRNGVHCFLPKLQILIIILSKQQHSASKGRMSISLIFKNKKVPAIPQ